MVHKFSKEKIKSICMSVFYISWIYIYAVWQGHGWSYLLLVAVQHWWRAQQQLGIGWCQQNVPAHCSHVDVAPTSVTNWVASREDVLLLDLPAHPAVDCLPKERLIQEGCVCVLLLCYGYIGWKHFLSLKSHSVLSSQFNEAVVWENRGGMAGRRRTLGCWHSLAKNFWLTLQSC